VMSATVSALTSRLTGTVWHSPLNRPDRRWSKVAHVQRMLLLGRRDGA
jgi:hypothetical protein